MAALLERFRRNPDRPVERLLFPEPSSADAVELFGIAFGRISEHLSQAMTYTPKQAFIVALLVVRWMRGYPLSRLITERIDYLKSRGTPQPIASVIRDVMTQVEQIALYHAPRLVSCYNDVLTYHLSQIQRQDLIKDIQDMSVYLELGVNQQTQLSLMTMGLSRTAAVLVSELIASDRLSVAECDAWFAESGWEERDLPALVKLEIAKVLTAGRSGRSSAGL